MGASREALSLTSVVCEVGKATGLPRSTDVPEWMRSCLLRRWLDICAAGVRGLRTWPRTFWSKRDSSLRLFSCDGACDTLPGLTLPTPSWFPTALLLAVTVTARAWAALHTGRRLRCPGAYYPGRILLAEQQVFSVGPPTWTQLHRRPRVAPERHSSAALGAWVASTEGDGEAPNVRCSFLFELVLVWRPEFPRGQSRSTGTIYGQSW